MTKNRPMRSASGDLIFYLLRAFSRASIFFMGSQMAATDISWLIAAMK
jgi:hypothetical protein